MKRMGVFVVMTLAVLAVARAAGPNEAEYRAPGCCSGGLYPVCRRVAVVKKKPHVEYSVECEPVCVPGCSLLDGCSSGCSCSNATIRKKKTLLKKITEKESPSYEYKIFWVCRSCAFGPGCCDEVSR